jgi:para-nitrobenzyl esterase
MNPIKLDTGYITGSVASQPDHEVNIFKGIPYAAPPVGNLRWKPPAPVASWSGVRACTEFSIQARR